MKILLTFSKNLHNKNLGNNKLYNGLKIRAEFLEISLKFKYFWNITRVATREYYSGIIVEISFSYVYDVNWNLVFHE